MAETRLHDAGGLHQAWPALLVIATTGSSVVFACAVPFAAFGVLAAMTLSRADALRITVVLWLTNQAVGYLLLGYPRTVNSVAWGLILGGVAIVSLLVAQRIASTLRTAPAVLCALAAFGGSFLVYEALLYVFAVGGLGGTSSFAPAIVGRIVAVNAVALGGLFGLYRLGVVLGVSRPRVPAAAPARPASS